ncbi:hypothetical protein DFJ73DRAFT_13211 [Zopfochytrium polystomum]|nr:hypothetical protein DFJ73DRAFT_13211 [Zopfochytrium polystomum]
MKLLSLFTTAAALVLSLPAVVSAACTNPLVRREWSSLNSSQKSQYLNAILALSKRPLSRQGIDSAHPITDYSTLSLGDITATHTKYAYWAHGNAQFFPYHRALLWNFEQALATVGWTQGVVYFDWALYGQSWTKNDLFSAQYGGTWTTSKSDCLADGLFKKGAYSVSTDPPSGPGLQRDVTGDLTCLRRNSMTGSALLDPLSLLPWYASSGTYSNFQHAGNSDDTFNWHATVHGVWGGDGDMGNPYYSPNDFLFYFHHGMVDKIWFKWQSICEEYRTSYTGSLNSGGQASLSEVLDSWYIQASDVIDTRSGSLCYVYEKTASDIAFTAPNCPSGAPPNLDPWANLKSVDVKAEASATTSATPSPTPGASGQWLTQQIQALVLVNHNLKGRRGLLDFVPSFLNSTVETAKDIINKAGDAVNEAVDSVRNVINNATEAVHNVVDGLTNSTTNATVAFNPLQWAENVTIADDQRSVILQGVKIDVPEGFVLAKIFPSYVLVVKEGHVFGEVVNGTDKVFKMLRPASVALNFTMPPVWTPEDDDDEDEKSSYFSLFNPVATQPPSATLNVTASGVNVTLTAPGNVTTTVTVNVTAIAQAAEEHGLVIDKVQLPTFLSEDQLSKWPVDAVVYRLWENKVRKLVHYYNQDDRSQSPAVYEAQKKAAELAAAAAASASEEPADGEV